MAHLIKKNFVDSAGSTGIHVAYFAKNISIDSNIVSNTLQDMSGQGYEGLGIKFYAGFDSISITNNVSSNNATDGIALEGGADGKNFLIENNITFNNRRNGIKLLSGPIAIHKGGNIRTGEVLNNIAFGNKGDAISVLSENSNYTISSVTIKNNNLKAGKGLQKIKVGKGLKVKY